MQVSLKKFACIFFWQKFAANMKIFKNHIKKSNSFYYIVSFSNSFYYIPIYCR